MTAAFEHLFITDPLDSLNRPLDSSLRIMFELSRLGHEIRVTTPAKLSWDLRENGAKAKCAKLRFANDPTDFQTDTEEWVSLKSFSALHMRKDPPYDLEYVATTWLLDTALPEVRVYNSPEALRRFNEKLAIFLFPDACHPALVSSDPTELFGFLEDCAAGDGVLKPLTLFGGRGVQRLQLHQDGREKVLATLRHETGEGTQLRLIQPFDQGIFSGEVRAFTAFGKAIAWCLKRPAAGNFLANTRAGATLEAYTPSPQEVLRVEGVAQSLLANGVAFIGFDMIGGFISEVNLTSPRLLQAKTDRTNYYETIAAAIASDLR